jgi:hypothetical protein
MTIKPRTTKANQQRYIEFIRSDLTQEVLKSIPRHLHQKYLREGFEHETGIRITEYLHYKVMKSIKNNQLTLGGKTFVII